ncbi:hypothetical protein HID58_044267 [Brassica napus]|uniref:Uncharacterized protein n=1 Tax=Brassica napus TaxID=3708 RepID=A0ABQ8BIW8_BRANA|nr:hypothetical protein HID58_044267 [Brassica napus]
MGVVPPEQQDKWWSDFVQKYYWDSDHHNLVVKPHKGRLFGLGTAQMENYDHIAPPAVVLTRQAQLEKEVINLTGMVKLMSQQLTALCEARGVTASDATTNPSPSSPPSTSEPRI